jgi:transposase
MSICRKPYPSGVSPEEWSLVALYLLLQREDAGQRAHDLREVGDLLALHVTPASAEGRGEVERLARTVQSVTNDTVELAWVDQGYTGERAANAAAKHGIALEVVKLPKAKRGFVLLPRRWVV